MTRIRFTVSYDGTDYCGWQRQNQDVKPSLCQTIQEALQSIFKHEISLFASGRTDAGVHALNQVCHFDTSWPIERLNGFDLPRAIRNGLPPEIVIKRAWVAPDDFHSTISPDKKTYRYVVNNSELNSAILQRYTHWVRKPLDLDYLNMCAKQIIGEHDFKSFQSVGSDVAHTIRTIESAAWSWKSKNIAHFSITGSGFLKQMVRNLVGTQLLLERKKQDYIQMSKILEAKDRKMAGPPAPAQGLYLIRVYYPSALDNRCREL